MGGQDSGAIQDLLGIAEDPTAGLDPASFLTALGRAAVAAGRRPWQAASVGVRFGLGSATALGAAARRTFGDRAPGPVAPAKGDKRFADPAFEDNPLYFLLEQTHLLLAQALLELLDVAALPDRDDRKARFGGTFLLDAMAPTNTFLGNPAAVRRAFETAGKSVVRGARNFVHDVRHNGGWPAQVDSSPFEVGRNMATTPGKVIHRTALIELIQYEPQTPKVHRVPLLFCPPWINKYYIMDLAPRKSLIEWAVTHGHTCFAISYRNPDESMRDVTFEDYLRDGPLDAIDVVREITGAPKVNMLSVCLGGTLTAIALALNAQTGVDTVNSATFLNSHTDFSHPGVLGVFTDEDTVANLEKRMEAKGYLEASDMARTFDAIRANDLVFQYVVNNWLLGEQPPAFDLLAWNGDSTRMPAKMHSRYLRSCYLRNEFAHGEFEIEGHKLDPGAVDVDTYVLSAVDDHIVPWLSAYQTTQLLGGRNRFVLSTSGHIAGIVNPPNPKAKHWTNDEALPADADAWLAGATLHDETWWEDWARWIARRAGPKVAAPTSLGSAAHPPLDDAPGTYVRTRA